MIICAHRTFERPPTISTQCYVTVTSDPRTLGSTTNPLLADSAVPPAKFFDRLTLLGGFFTLRQHEGKNDALAYAAYANVFSLGLTPSAPAAATGAQSYSTSKESGLFINATLDLGFLLKALASTEPIGTVTPLQ